MPTFTLTGGVYGDPAFIGMQGILTLSSPMTTVATGDVSRKSWTVTVGPGGTWSLSGLPYNDDPALTPIPTSYSMEWQVIAWKDTPGNRTFQVLVGSGVTTVDFDNLPRTGVATTAPTAGVPFVTAVNGHSGAVTLAASDVGADAAGAATAAQAAAVVAAAADASNRVAAEVTRADGKYVATAGLDAATAPLVTGNGTTAVALRAAIDAEVALGGAGLPSTIVNRTAAYTASPGDFVQADTSAAGFTITLPAAPKTGALVTVKKISPDLNTVTVAPATGGSVDGDATATTSIQWAAATFEHVGSNVWRVVTASVAGTQGPTGATGATGPVGPTGPQGPAGLPATVTNQSGAYTALAGDLVQATTTTAGFIVTLPASPGVGALVTTIKVSSDGNTLTVAPSNAGTINGDPTATATVQWAKATFEHVGSDTWRLV